MNAWSKPDKYVSVPIYPPNAVLLFTMAVGTVRSVKLIGHSPSGQSEFRGGRTTWSASFLLLIRATNGIESKGGTIHRGFFDISQLP